MGNTYRHSEKQRSKGMDGCPLTLIALSDADIIVSPLYIKLGEVSCTFESMDEIIDEGEGVLIFSRDGIKCSM
jgi:hypothetical protein